MTGTTEKKTPPRDDAEWARDVQQRVENVEHPTSLRAGAWVFSTDPDSGALIASHVNGGSVVIAEVPDATEGTADEVSSNQLRAIKVARTIADGITTVQWNSVEFAVGDWEFTPPATDVVIPADGYYWLTGNIYSDGANTSTQTAFIRINGTNRLMMRRSGGSGVSSTASALPMNGLFQLSAGDSITVFVENTGGVGPSSVDGNVITTLSVTEWRP